MHDMSVSSLAVRGMPQAPETALERTPSSAPVDVVADQTAPGPAPSGADIASFEQALRAATSAAPAPSVPPVSAVLAGVGAHMDARYHSMLDALSGSGALNGAGLLRLQVQLRTFSIENDFITTVAKKSTQAIDELVRMH